MLDEVERSVHDAICAVKRVLESRSVLVGGGAVESALSIYLDDFARTLGSKEQLAISEFAESLLTIPKTLALNAAQDASELVAKLKMYHAASQTSSEAKKKEYKHVGLDLLNGKVRNNYSAEDLRITIVYRARCFRDEFEAKSYSEKHFGENTQNLLELEEILETFAKDLVSRGKVTSVERALQEMPRFELALLIMDTYIKYPYPTKSDVVVPWNYCALPRLMPWTRYILEYVCS